LHSLDETPERLHKPRTVQVDTAKSVVSGGFAEAWKTDPRVRKAYGTVFCCSDAKCTGFFTTFDKPEFTCTHCQRTQKLTAIQTCAELFECSAGCVVVQPVDQALCSKCKAPASVALLD
jgi:hypothetical protein